MPILRDVLTHRAPITVPGEASVLDASRTMVAEGVGCVMIVDAEGAPLGIFTERDLMSRVVVEGRDPATLQVREVMTRELLCAGPEDKVVELRRALRTKHVRHLPVVEDGRLIGVLSLRDLLRSDLAQTRVEVDALQEYIQGDLPKD